jgi:integrase
MDFQSRLNQANGRLKRSRIPVRIAQRGDRLYVRGTFPPAPGSVQNRPHQQRIALGVAANPRGLVVAEQRAKEIGVALEGDKFRWEDWRGEQPRSVGEWCAKLKGQRQVSPETWITNYQSPFNKLPMGKPLTVGLLVKTLKDRTEPDTRSRLKAYDAFRQLATLAGLDPSPLAPLRGSYSASAVDPRDLPSDEEIVAYRAKITNPGWCWVYGMMAAYGLRSHEVFRADLEDFPTIRIPEETKTGIRFVWPLHPEWADRWQLNHQILPPLVNIPNYTNQQLGHKVANFFWRLRNEIPIVAYDLRHCYARRGLEYGYAPEFGAKMMGHSPDVHNSTYRRWIDEGVYRRIYERGIMGSDRPPAP